jgi:hypothetical protein
MILQRDIRLRKPIREMGCYYLSLLFLANKYTNCPLTVRDINSTLFFRFIQMGWMDANCFIKNPGAILQDMKFYAAYTGRHEPPTYQCAKNECEILRFEHPDSFGHFVVGDGSGNVAYDPWGVSRAATEGELYSKRIFRF